MIRTTIINIEFKDKTQLPGVKKVKELISKKLGKGIPSNLLNTDPKTDGVIFKKYSIDDPRFRDCDNVLNRRGDEKGFGKVFISNGELYNLKELANYIIKISKNMKEYEVAEATLKIIAELEQNLATKT